MEQFRESHQTVSGIMQKKDEILGQKTKPGSLDCHVDDLRRTEFEKRLIKKLGEMFDYGNVSQATIEQEATALSEEMPEVKFATGTKFKRCWIRGFTQRMNWVFKRVQGSKRRIEQEVMDKCQKQTKVSRTMS